MSETTTTETGWMLRSPDDETAYFSTTGWQTKQHGLIFPGLELAELCAKSTGNIPVFVTRTITVHIGEPEPS